MPHLIVVGAGPAGASLAYLLASRGVDVTLVERQRDFAREFRGEVLMPSGVEALERMGLGAVLAAAPQWQPDALKVYLNRELVIELPLDPAFFGGHPPTAVSQPGLLEGIVAAAAQVPRLPADAGRRGARAAAGRRARGRRARPDRRGRARSCARTS